MGNRKELFLRSVSSSYLPGFPTCEALYMDTFWTSTGLTMGANLVRWGYGEAARNFRKAVGGEGG